MAAKSTNNRFPTMTRRKKVAHIFSQAYNPIRQNAFEVTTAKVLEVPFKDILSMAIFDAADTLLILEEEHMQRSQNEKV